MVEFLATLVALYFTPVSEWVSRWAESRTSLASRLASLLKEKTIIWIQIMDPEVNHGVLWKDFKQNETIGNVFWSSLSNTSDFNAFNMRREGVATKPSFFFRRS